VPIYEYRCEKCGKHLEALQQVSEPPLTTCPDCSGELKKLLSAPAFQFKGSGWYVTDYAGKSGGGTDEKAASGDKKSGGKGSGEATETKKDKSDKAEKKSASKS
jgi:putative FmdB family regulatory protein